MNKKRLQKLHRIYSRIPKVECKGLCHDACSLLGMSEGEFVQLTRVSGKEPAVTNDYSCNYLTDSKRCSVYNDRPAICRLFGTGDFLPCPFGCEIEGNMTDAESRAILAEIGKEFGDQVLNTYRVQAQAEMVELATGKKIM